MPAMCNRIRGSPTYLCERFCTSSDQVSGASSIAAVPFVCCWPMTSILRYARWAATETGRRGWLSLRTTPGLIEKAVIRRIEPHNVPAFDHPLHTFLARIAFQLPDHYRTEREKRHESNYKVVFGAVVSAPNSYNRRALAQNAGNMMPAICRDRALSSLSTSSA
jgi:hypothetical protein